MAYKEGDILPAKQNLTMQNPGPNAGQTAADNWQAVQAQDKAWMQNQTLMEEFNLQKGTAYGDQLGAKPSWGVVVQITEIGAMNFDQQRVGPAVSTLS